MLEFKKIPRDESVTVGTSSTELSPSIEGTDKRSMIIITNISTGGQIVDLAFGKPAVAGKGIRLYPTGSWFEVEDQNFSPTNKAINCISSAAGATIEVHERTE